jgi:hypothetical protein
MSSPNSNNSSSSSKDSSKDSKGEWEKELVSSLHKHIRLSNWAEVELILKNEEQMKSQSFANSKDEEQLRQPLILRPNSIGWTAMHFTVLHCAPSS